MASFSAAPRSDSSVDVYVRAVVLAAAGQLLRTDLIVTLTPTGGGTDMGNNDVVTAVKSEDLYGAQVS
jgi:hypothetical protein